MNEERDEPFLLLTRTAPLDAPVTNEQLSEQIGMLSSHLAVVHREVNLVRTEVIDTRTQLSELRSFVLSDHGPRITEVEKRAPITIPPGAKVAGKYASIALAIPALLQVAATLKPSLAGPLEMIAQLFGGP